MEYLKTLEIISNFLVSITLIVIWIDYAPEIKGLQVVRRYLNFKPFNCLWCLSFWAGVGLTLWTRDYIYLSMPLVGKILYR